MRGSFRLSSSFWPHAQGDTAQSLPLVTTAQCWGSSSSGFCPLHPPTPPGKAIDPSNATAEHALQPSHSQPRTREKAPSVLVCFKIAQAFASPITARWSAGVNFSAITSGSDWDPETYNAIPNCLTDTWTHQTVLQPANSRHCTQYCHYR